VTTWLVTGGAGYIGSHVARRLLESGRDVVVLDDLSTGHREFVPEGVPFVDAPTYDEAAVAQTFASHPIDGIVHLAALKYAGVSVDEPLRFYRANVDGMRALLQAAVEAGVQQFVYSSSCGVYGTPRNVPVREDEPWAPESPYGETKLIGEWLLAATAVAHPMRHTSLRYFNVVGSGYDDVFDSSPHNIFPKVFAALDAGGRPVVQGTDYDTPDGSCVRDYVHVGDLADAHVAAAAALEAGTPLQPAYNIGVGIGSSVLEVMAAISRVVGRDLDLEIIGRRPGDPAAVYGDPTAAQEDLGFTVHHDLDDMVATAWRAWRATHD
jgi:UDP-glucose 4-epimerase